MFYRLSMAILILVILGVSMAASVAFQFNQWLDRPLDGVAEDTVLSVAAGSSVASVAHKLANSGYIANSRLFLLHHRLIGQPTIIKGNYAIPSTETPRGLMARLVAGDVLRYSITFPEGRTVAQWLARLNNSDQFEGAPVTLQDVGDAIVPPTGETLEGWLFPDTYSYTDEESALDILMQAHLRMREVLEEEWQGRSDDLPLETPYDALILASIVEKETGVPDERGAIAGVFIRRLQKGMKLQTDPTVIYGLGETFDGNLTRTHLQADNPFNSYVNHGLPPTPIANPGRDAIHAALHPTPGEALYFVAKGDGSHQFSATLSEHRKAVREFQLKRVKNYRSSPKLQQ